jgi:hypothetical protein
MSQKIVRITSKKEIEQRIEKMFKMPEILEHAKTEADELKAK